MWQFYGCVFGGIGNHSMIIWHLYHCCDQTIFVAHHTHTIAFLSHSSTNSNHTNNRMFCVIIKTKKKFSIRFLYYYCVFVWAWVWFLFVSTRNDSSAQENRKRSICNIPWNCLAMICEFLLLEKNGVALSILFGNITARLNKGGLTGNQYNIYDYAQSVSNIELLICVVVVKCGKFYCTIIKAVLKIRYKTARLIFCKIQ